jgi:hypothetical protein
VVIGGAAVLASAVGGFLGVTDTLTIARPGLLFVSTALFLVALGFSYLATHVLRDVPVRFSRIDLLRAVPRPPAWHSTVVIIAFVLAIAGAFFAVFPRTEAKDSPSAAFGREAVAPSGTQQKVTFTVTWTHLDGQTDDVLTTVTDEQGAKLEETSQGKESDGSAKQQVEVLVTPPQTITASSQPRDNAGNPRGAPKTRNYKIK